MSHSGDESCRYCEHPPDETCCVMCAGWEPPPSFSDARRIADLEAQCAAMRSALTGQARRLFTDYGGCFCDGDVFRGTHDKACAAAKAALASDAGKALLERLERAEKEHAADLEDLRMVMRHCSEIYDYASGGIISKPNTYPSEVIALSQERENRDIEEARDAALEEAAQVADDECSGHDLCGCSAIADRVRALKGKA